MKVTIESDNSERDHRDSLLTEYTACTQRVVASGGWAWQSTSIVVGASFAAAALVSSRFQDTPMFLAISLGAGMFVILLLLPFYFRREGWRQKVLFNRMAEIESELGMEIGLDIQNLDTMRGVKDKDRAKKKLEKEGVGQAKVERYWDLHHEKGLSSPGRFGWEMATILTDSAAVVWILVIMKFLVRDGEEWSEWRWVTLGLGSALLILVNFITWPNRRIFVTVGKWPEAVKSRLRK